MLNKEMKAILEMVDENGSKFDYSVTGKNLGEIDENGKFLAGSYNWTYLGIKSVEY